MRADVTARSALAGGNPLVLAATDYLSEDTFVTLGEATRRQGMGIMPWKRKDELALGHRPSVVVAGLPPGSRRIPEDLAQTLARVFPFVPVLLLCGEPLVRSVITLQGGRLTLIGAPLSASKIGSRMRMLLASSDDGQPSGDCIPGGEWVEDRDVATNEQRRPDYWAGGFACRDAATPRYPVLHHRVTTGLTAVLTDVARPAFDMDRITTILRSGVEDAPKELALFELLGDEQAVLHLTPGAEEWVLYWPRSDWSLSIHSPVRVPHIWELANARHPALRRMPAAGGDLVIALTARPSAAGSPEYREAMIDGGPRLLELLGSDRFASERPFSGLVVEVL